MPDAVFPFPGGKSRLASWILDHVPEHTCYVEVFGGAAGVLMNKDPSTVEVYNDLDSDLVHFFETLRERHDELVEWLDDVPYSRELHKQWVDQYYRGYRPVDDIERAGQFFYLRYSQWGSGYDGPNGFATSKVASQATSYANKIDRLQVLAERFDEVVIENLDWRDVFEKYDSDETVFYADPPYVDKGDYYRVGGIDHAAFLEAVGDLDGEAVVSYGDLPEGADQFTVAGKGSKTYINNGKRGQAKDTREHLVMNFDPEAVPLARGG